MTIPGFTYNITFVVNPEREEKLIRYIREILYPRLFSEESPARYPELKKVVEIGGETPGADHGLSMALSASFEDKGKAYQWNDEILLPALDDFKIKFGPHSLFFVTLLQNFPLD